MTRTIAATTVLLAGLVLPTVTAPTAHASSAVPPTCDGLPATIVGTQKDDVLVGTNGPDVILGKGGNDLIKGRGGNDVICGADGSDTLLGGKGDDQLFGGQDEVSTVPGVGVTFLGDVLVGGPGNDVLDGGGDARDIGVPAVNGNIPDVLDYRGVHPHHGKGVTVRLDKGTASGAGKDTITAGRYAVYGTSGADYVVGSPFSDVIRTYGGDDTVFGGAGDDEIFPDQGSLTDTPDRDVVHAGDGNDLVISHDGGDRIFGAAGDDTLIDYGQNGVDRFVAGPGNDVIEQVVSAPSGEVADGGDGTDSIENLDGPFPKATMTCLRIEDLTKSGPYC